MGSKLQQQKGVELQCGFCPVPGAVQLYAAPYLTWTVGLEWRFDFVWTEEACI